MQTVRMKRCGGSRERHHLSEAAHANLHRAVDRLPVNDRSYNLRVQNLPRWDLHDILREHNIICALAGLDRAQSVFSEGGIGRVQRQP